MRAPLDPHDPHRRQAPARHGTARVCARRRGPAWIALTLAWLALACSDLRAGSRAEVPELETAIRRPASATPAPCETFLSPSPSPHPFCSYEGSLSALEQSLFADAADGRLDDHSLLAAALIAAGETDARVVARYEARLEALADELANSGKAAVEPMARARAVFEFMHRTILRGGYDLGASDPGEALDHGRFNCVTASVLFNSLCERFSLTARGLEVPGHAMSRLVLPERTLDVETTCPRWFELKDDPKRQAEAVARTTGFRHTTGASARREVSAAQLVATIYYNRGVDRLSEGRFEEALAANAKALRLDPNNATARGNLLATMNNWAIALGRQGRYAEAAALLRRGIALDPSYATFGANLVHVHHERSERLCREGRFEEAVDLLAGAAAEQPDSAYFRQALLGVFDRWARQRLQAGRTEEAFGVLAEMRRRLGAGGDVLRVEAAALNDHALRLVDEARFEAALAVWNRALAAQPDSAMLHENRRAAAMRWAAPAFRDGNYREAIRRTKLGGAPDRLHEDLVANICFGYDQWVRRLESQGRHAEAARVRRRAQADPIVSGREGAVLPASGKP